MDLAHSHTAPAKLYAFLLKLRPLQAGTLMAYSGELVHGAWLNWLKETDPDVATWLHDENRRRAFTCSSLQFPIPVERMLEAERKNVHLPLNPDKTYTVRITLLLGELFPLFYNALMEFNMSQLAGSATYQGLSGASGKGDASVPTHPIATPAPTRSGSINNRGSDGDSTRATQASPPIIPTAPAPTRSRILASIRDGTQQPFMRIGKQFFSLEEVVISNDDPSGWAGFTSFTNLVEKAKVLKLDTTEPLTLEFATLTSFNRSNVRNKAYGVYHARLPLPQFIFPGLARRWGELAPSELASVVQEDAIEQYIQDDGMIIADYDLKTHHVRFTTHEQAGFVGTCMYHLRKGTNEVTRPETPLTVRQQILLLAQLAFFCGVGHKASMGLGRVRQV